MICDLPMDLAEEVLSKLPVTSLKVVRSTCKKLNTLSKSRGFTRKLIANAAKKKEFQVVMLLENGVSLMRVNLISPSIDPIGKLNNANRVSISEIYHCEGLLLCITKGDKLNSSQLVVWNPFLGQTRWIQPRNSYDIWDKYALGYDKSLGTHKILRFVDSREPRSERKISEFEIYNLNSNSWKVLDITPDWQWHMKFDQRGLSLKGNTFWYAQEKIKPDEVGFNVPDFLVCFDFTTESFGPHLPLPFHGFVDTVSLSNVAEKQLAVLFQKYCSPAYTLKIWITDNVEPYAVSWKELFLSIDMRPNVGFRFADRAASFFVDEEKNLAVVLDKDRKYFNHRGGRNMAYIIGKNGCVKRVDIGVSKDQYCNRRVCSFVPSSVQI